MCVTLADTDWMGDSQSHNEIWAFNSIILEGGLAAQRHSHRYRSDGLEFNPPSPDLSD